MNRKWAFFQAFLLAGSVFIVGLYFGMSFEQGRAEVINDYYIQSEVALIDLLSLNHLIDSGNISCSKLESANYRLLDRVYEDAQILSKYEESEKLSDSLKSFHKKYDSLRTYLWINSRKISELCGRSANVIVYLYRNDQQDLAKKAEQNIWSKLLRQLKEEKGRDLFLIPIAVDTQLVSLETLIRGYEIKDYPAIIINDEKVFDKLVKKEEVESFLN